MIEIVITEKHKKILMEKVLANESRLKKIVESSNPIHPHGKKYRLTIQEEDADLIRDLCGTNLQQYGFDEKYEITEEGRLLEDLIDIFYVNRKTYNDQNT